MTESSEQKGRRPLRDIFWRLGRFRGGLLDYL
jgi:hypothetical protein